MNHRAEKKRREEYFRQRAKNEPKTQRKNKSEPVELPANRAGGAPSFLPQKRERAFDPRFDERCGDLDQLGVVKNYSFLQDTRKSELRALVENKQEVVGEIGDEAYKKAIQSLRDQIKTFDSKKADLDERMKWHQEERERVLAGKKPYWVSKHEMKEKELKRKYDELQGTGKLKSYLKKRHERLSAKDKRDARRNKL